MIGNPNLKHKEVEVLYQHDFSIPKELIQAILQLPRPSLIKDLEEILNEAMRNYGNYDRDYDDEPEESNFLAPAHALFLLGELEAIESLPTINKFLSQDFEKLDFWLGDLNTEELWAPIYKLAQSDITQLFGFIKKVDIDEFSNSPHMTAVSAYFVLNVEKEPELLPKYQTLLTELTEMAENAKENWSREAQNISYLVWGFMDWRISDLLPEMEVAIKRNLIQEYPAEEWEEAKQIIQSSPEQELKIPTLFEQYDRINEWYSATDIADFGSLDMGEYGINTEEYWQERVRQTKLQGSTLHSGKTPFQRETPKVGRNDPCPCGSGKKYKKCCLKKG